MLQLRSAGGSYAIAVNSDGLDTDFLGNERFANPSEGDTVDIDGTPYVWTRVFQDDSVWADDSALDNFVTYISAAVLPFSDQDVRLAYRHDDGVKIWAYGAVIAHQPTADSAQEAFSDTIRLTAFQKTRLLIKLHERTGRNYFSARLVDLDGAEASDYVLEYTRGGLSSEGVITILSPLAGEKYQPGDTLAIVWTIDSTRLQSGVAPYVSVDDGISYHDLVGELIAIGDPEYSGDTGTFLWAIPDSMGQGEDPKTATVSAVCRVRVYAQYEPDKPTAISGQFSIAGDTSAIRFSPIVGRSTTAAAHGAGRIHINFEGTGFDTHVVEFVNAQGQCAVSQRFRGSRATVNTSRLSPGIYVLRVQSRGSEERFRLVVPR